MLPAQRSMNLSSISTGRHCGTKGTHIKELFTHPNASSVHLSAIDRDVEHHSMHVFQVNSRAIRRRRITLRSSDLRH